MKGSCWGCGWPGGRLLTTGFSSWQPPGPENLFVNYLSRIHREEASSFPTVALQGAGGCK